MNIGKAIKTLRKEKGLSQVELATKIGITQAALSGIEGGKRPNTENLRKICSVLGVSEALIYILGMEKDDVPNEKRVLYDSLFPVIQSLVMQIASK